MNCSLKCTAVTLALLAPVTLLHAQRGGNDWMTTGYDAQRSFWVRVDPKISPESMSKPGFEQVWKLQLGSQPRQSNSLTPPSLLDFYIGYRGFRTLGFFADASGKVVGVDTDIHRIEWNRSFPAPGASSINCPGGITSPVTRPTTAGYPPLMGGGGRGRGSAAKSGVGEPNQGAVTLAERLAQRPAAPPPPVAARASRRTAPASNPFGRSPQFAVAITPDGMLHHMYVSNGEEPNPPIPFLPAGANAHGLVVFDNTAYAATVNRCGGAADGVWALNLETKKTANWKAPAGVAGSGGPAADPDGNLYVASGKQLFSLAPGTLAQKAAYSGPQAFSSSPVVFENQNKDFIAATTADGRLHVFDSSLKLLASSTPFAPGYDTGALASWQDQAGARWILAPSSKSIVAWKFTGAALEPGWTSRDMISPLTPAIVNGVVFAISSGQAASGNTPAVLYALNGASGKELWNSGGAIGSFVHSGGLSAGGSRVYVGANNGVQYAFGFPIEH